MWIRWSVSLLLEYVAWTLTGAGIVVAVAVAVGRGLALGLDGSLACWLSLIVGMAGAFLLWTLRCPRRMDVAIEIDRRVGLRERFSTAVALADQESGFAKAACKDAHKAAEHIAVVGQFPIRLSRRWLLVGAAWVLALGVGQLMPELDLFGWGERDRLEKQKQEDIRQVKTEIDEATLAIKATLTRLGDGELAAELPAMEDVGLEREPEQMKRETIRKLGDVAESLRKMQGDNRLGSLEEMEKMLKGLRGTSGEMSRELSRSLAKGDFSRAAEQVRQLQEELVKRELSQNQQRELARQLKALAEQLQQLAERNEGLEKELEKSGLKPGLAKLGEKELRKALQESGLDAEKIEKLMKKARACRSASSSCEGLARALAGCGAAEGELAGDALAELAEQLSELESLQQEIAMLEASLAEIGRAVASLGKGAGLEGMGGKRPWSEGLSLGESTGSGGPGKGRGPRETEASGDIATESERVKNAAKAGPVIASWYFHGDQIKGEARQGLTNAVQTARDAAAEAINENRVPRKYESTVKRYFGELGEQGSQSDK